MLPEAKDKSGKTLARDNLPVIDVQEGSVIEWESALKSQRREMPEDRAQTKPARVSA